MNITARLRIFLALSLIVSALTSLDAAGEPSRLKDLVTIRGVRSNHLNGLGLVVGLRGTGDSKKSLATNRAVANMLTRMGMKTKPEDIAAGNMAAVMVTGELKPFGRIGDQVDVKVSAVGDAKSLAGGTLMLTPLAAGDGKVYALSQGAVVVGQASGKGTEVLTVARVPSGASIEREFIPEIGKKGVITLSLKQPDFTTSSRIADEVNAAFKGFYATAEDVSAVAVMVPPAFETRLVDFIAELESVTVDADVKAVVVLNERTGTVVMGGNVVIGPVAIAHGDLSIRVEEKGEKGKKAGKPKDNALVKVKGTTVGELVETMNSLGVKPMDLVGILQSLHAAGALNAELKFL